MVRQIIDRGTTGNDGTGDDLYTGAGKINDNFEELYGNVAQIQTIVGTDSASIKQIQLSTGGITFEGATADSFETVLGVIDPTKDRAINLPDSSGTIALTKNIDSAVNNTINTIDSDYVQERTREANIDRITLKNFTVATAPDSSEVTHGTLIFVKDGNTGLPCLGVFDSDLGNFRRIELGSYINT
tara:strand:+ start:3417 stop:3974 length:558 start_codon:yes stop_codon:yes gene_type:complete